MRTVLISLALPLFVVTSAACTKAVDSGNGAPSPEPAAPGSAAPAEPAAAPAKVVTPPFEGSLSIHLVAGKKEIEIGVVAKGGKIRADFPGAKGQAAEHTLYDPATKQTTVLSEAHKTATTIAAATASSVPFRTATKAGIHELIGGRDCEDWDAVDVTGKRETLCIADGFATLDINAMLPPDSGFPAIGSWLSDLRAKDQFPLRAVVTDTSGAIELHWEISKIDSHSIDDATFTTPSGYVAH